MCKPHFNSVKSCLISNYTLLIYSLILSLFIRLHYALRMDLWLDEANTVLISASSFHEIIERMKYDSSPPLIYFVYWLLLIVFPKNIVLLKVVNICLSMITQAMIFKIIEGRYDKYTALLGSMLFSIFPISIYYSVTLRMYSLLMLLGILCFYFYLTIVNNNKGYLWYTICSIAIVYTHYYGIFVLLALNLLLTVQRKIERRLIVSQIAVFVLYIPWLPYLRYQVNNQIHYNWIVDYWKAYPSAFAIIRTMQSFLPLGFTYPYNTLKGMIDYQPIITTIYIVLFAFTVYVNIRKKALRGFAVQTALVTFLPLMLVTMYSIFLKPVYIAGRCPPGW